MSPSTSPEDIHQRAAILVAMLIDSNYIHHSYLEVLEIVSNDSNVIYRVRPSDSAASCTDELPSRVLSYKDKYLCFIELDEQEMSRNELFEKGIVADSNFQSNSLDFDDGFWLLALQKYGKEHRKHGFFGKQKEKGGVFRDGNKEQKQKDSHHACCNWYCDCLHLCHRSFDEESV